MTRPTKLLCFGVTVGLLTVVVGQLGTTRAQRELASLRQACDKQQSNQGGTGAVEASRPPIAERFAQLERENQPALSPEERFDQLEQENEPGTLSLATMLATVRFCDPEVLGKERRELITDDPPGVGVYYEPIPDARLPPGIPGDLVRAQRRLEAWQAIPFLAVATVAAVLSAVPWLWYFLLDRLRELSAAIRG